MFKYDVLIDEEDICNYEKEIQELNGYIKNKDKVVLFAPRRYGKTSILVNIAGKNFSSRKKNSIFCYVNLQEVQGLDSIAVRFSHALEDAVNRTFPVKTLVSNILDLLKSLRPQISVDSISGDTKFTISTEVQQGKNLRAIFRSLIDLSDKYPLLLVMDEFQDIAFVPESEALLREFVQKMSSSSVIISGSKKHILRNIFLDEQKPFYNWGKSLELKSIPFEKWKAYVTLRFKEKEIEAGDEVLRYILESVYYIPNYICKLCSDIYESYSGEKVTIADVEKIIHQNYLNIQSRYAEKIAFLTKKQIRFLTLIAKKNHLKNITSKDVVAESGISTRGLSQIYKMLLDKGFVEKDESGARISDPFFAYYLSREF